MPKPNDVGVGTALFVLNENDEILLGLRAGAHRANTWCCPGGWIDRPDETTDISTAREAAEEAGLTVDSRATLHLDWTSEDHPELGVRSITLYHVALFGTWSGTPTRMEPHKCQEWRWFGLNALPENAFPGVKEAAEKLKDLLGRPKAGANA